MTEIPLKIASFFHGTQNYMLGLSAYILKV